MRAVILAAGYGTRLQRDVEQDTSGQFRHLSSRAKPLLPVGHCALISHWIHALRASGCVEHIYVVTNSVFHDAFKEWAAEFSMVHILNDQTRSNDERLGAVACLQLAVKHFEIDDDVIVIGGDTLFREDFSLRRMKERFSELKALSDDSCLVLTYQCKDEETHKYGILEVDEDLRVICMKEKPLPTDTTSRRACPCFYVFSNRTLPQLATFLEEKKEAPIEQKDAPGNFLSWLIPRQPVYVQEICGRFDVGNLASYVECDQYFRGKLKDVTSYMV